MYANIKYTAFALCFLKHDKEVVHEDWKVLIGL